MNPKEMVAQSYNQIAHRFAAWAKDVRGSERDRYAAILLERLPQGARVLELGCGAGLATTRQLAERFSLTGVDISSEQIKLARQNVPDAEFICGDMCQLDLAKTSFDAVAAFYSIIHVPREEHAALFRSIALWLRPCGLFVASLGVGSAEADVEDNWLGFGSPMYWSHHDAATSIHLIETAGLHILSAKQETEIEDGIPVTFLWIVAEKIAGDLAIR